MKVNEFIELVKGNKNKLLKIEQLTAFIKKELEVKEYIGIKQKKELVDSIVNECILYEDGVFKFNDINKYICFTMRTIGAYTNLELSDDIEEDYDALCEAKLFDTLVNTFKNEYDDVSILLQMRCEYIISSNSIEAQVGRFLTGLMDKIDDFVGILESQVDNFDFSKLPVNKDDMIKLFDFIETHK